MSQDYGQEKRSSASSSGDENGKDQEFVDVHRELEKVRLEKADQPSEQEEHTNQNEKLIDLSNEATTSDDIINQITSTIAKAEQVITAEADSTSETNQDPKVLPFSQQEPSKQPTSSDEKPTVTIKKCTTCPVENFCNCLFEKLDAYPQVRDVLLWKCPKLSGGVFAASLLFLYCLATYSLVGLIGFLILLTMTIVGSYRLYLTILGYVKGTKDETFKKCTDVNFTIPKEKLNDLVNMMDTCGNKMLNKFKKLLLWDNLYASMATFFIAYVVYSIGCTFNTITLLTIGVIDAFTLPKVYSMYKVPIDDTCRKVHVIVEDALGKVKAKFPKLFPKKKSQ